MDAEKYKELVGGSIDNVLLNHAEQHGLIARAGVERLAGSVGIEFTPSIAGEIAGRVAGKLAEIAGINTREYTLILCRDLPGVLARAFPRGVQPATPGVPSVPLETMRGGVMLWEAVEGLSGRYHQFIDCGGKPCLVDATLATGVRGYPRVENAGWHMYFSLLDRWMLTPGTTGLAAFPRGSRGLECEPPSVLELLYLEGIAEFYLRMDPGVVTGRIVGLTGEYGWMLDKAGYTPITPPEDEYRAGIISLHLPLSKGELERLRLGLLKRGVRVGLYRRIMRISPHLYNTPGDLDPVLQSLP